MFRVGTGWTSPEMDGSWTRPEGGRLAITLPQGTGAVRVGLLLLGSPHGDFNWQVAVRGGPSLGGALFPGRRRWVSFTAEPVDGAVQVWLRSEASESEADREQTRPDSEEAVVGLAGFFVHRADDAAAGLRLFEAIALDNLEDVDAYRAPPPKLPEPDWDQL